MNALTYKTFIIALVATLSPILMSLPIDTDNIAFSTPEAVDMSSDRLFQLDSLIEKYIVDQKIQGAVVAVSRYGELVYFEAHGNSDRSSKIEMQRDSMFQMWSSTKPVLGVATMIAMERGLFKPSDSVHKYLPAFEEIRVAVLDEPKNRNISPAYVWAPLENSDAGFFTRLFDRIWFSFTDGFIRHVPAHRTVPVDRSITIHDLLTHTAGIGTYGLGVAVSKWGAEISNKSVNSMADETLESLINKVAHGPLDFQPGTRWMYSPFIGLDVVARIIELTSGQPFNEFVKKNIFEPLDMQDTYWNTPPPDKLSRVVVISDMGKDKKGKSKSVPTKSSYYSGSVGLISTARDFLHFEQMLLDKGVFRGHRLISADSVNLMSTNHVGDLFSSAGKGKAGGEGFGYAVSVTLDPKTALIPKSKGAFGWAGAAGTISWNEPQTGLAVVIMVQQPTKELPIDVSKTINSSLL